MKAMLSKEVGGPETLVLEDLPTPDPKKNHVRIRVHAAGLNFPDTLIIREDAEGDVLEVTIAVQGGDTVLSLANGSQVILRGVTDFDPIRDDAENIVNNTYFYGGLPGL